MSGWRNGSDLKTEYEPVWPARAIRAQWRDALMCDYTSIARNLSTHVVTIRVPKSHATHMVGAITMARDVDPDVEQIDVYVGGVHDTIYHRDGDWWTAYVKMRGSWLHGEPVRFDASRRLRSVTP